MEWLETLLPFILLFIYFLSRLGRKRGKQDRTPAPNQPSATAAAPGARTPFEELMRQIQKAATEAQQAQHPAPAAPPAPPPATRPLRPALAPPPAPEFKLAGGFEHEQHGFGPDSPFSEEAFERLPRGMDVTEHAPGHLTHDPHGLFQRPGTPAPARRHPLAERLRDPGTARDAFALREILGAPRARRRR